MYKKGFATIVFIVIIAIIVVGGLECLATTSTKKQDINKTQTDIIEPIYFYKWPKNQGDFIFAIFIRPKPKDKKRN